MSTTEVLLQQLITGLSNGMIIALIALGYTMVYGIIELINFAHGDLFMLGGFLALTIVGMLGLDATTGNATTFVAVGGLVAISAIFCGSLNWTIDRLAYKPLRRAPKLAPLVSAIGVSFVLMNIGLFWGGLPMDVFSDGVAAAAPKDFPALASNKNLLGEASDIRFTVKELMVLVITVPLMIGLTMYVKYTRTGKAMRAVAQNPIAAQLMGIDVNRVIGTTFIIGGALGGAASVIYSLYNNTIHFQMGYRAGMDAFTAAVLGGIGSLPGAMLGGLLIGLVRAMSDQYIEARWTNAVVFTILILILIFRPSGLLGARLREKV
ncbi:MAG: branched-chain amino acid ABC transporter permease [Phycisphaerales bacterium]|nr:branched-chain amino acid ABC transporter permease [Phycisphaerales bacterium]MCI0629152.1 branched-chain amino acid ABC transporter permease [Phycisphaerales bacterium]MCI0676611.1 branched-chain amino acid ABC transporter permease [Phycisphaerales bacterium]